MEPFEYIEDGKPGHFRINSWMKQHPDLTAGFSSRLDGVGSAPYASLNLGLHVGDDPHNVIANRSLLADAAGVSLTSWTYGEQVHDCQVQKVEAIHGGRGTRSREDAFADKDAFITNEAGMVLAALFADCVPLYFLDPRNKSAGLAHAGWKGTVLQIAKHTVQAMKQEYGTRPEDLLAAIGPSIGACCYEVDEAMAVQFHLKLGELCTPYIIPSIRSGRFMLNLQEINRKIMIEAGILPQHIEITKLCTGCNLSHFFSHRKENGLTGRMAAWIGWKKA